MTRSTDTGKNPADDTRDARLRLRAWLWGSPRDKKSTIRVQTCGRKRIAGFVAVKGNGETAGLGGLSTCGSCWVCPVCSPKIAATRTVEVQDTIRAWQAQGGSVLLATLTLSHSRDNSLSETWDAVGRGWAGVRNGNGWKADVAEFGIAGYARIVEVTHSRRNGWHPHAHVLLFVKGTPTDEDCERLRARLFGRWSASLEEKVKRDGTVLPAFKTLDFDKDGKAVGVDVRRADAATVEYLAEYLAKFGYSPRSEARGLALEATRGDLKKGRSGSRTPWEILEAARDGSRAAQALWSEWEETSLGRRQYAWALGFRESLDVEGVVSDHEAAERGDARLTTLALLTADAWAALVADLRSRARFVGGVTPLISQALAVAAVGDGPQLRRWLTDHGIEHVSPEDAAADGYNAGDVPKHPTTVRFNRGRQARRDRLASPLVTKAEGPACRRCDLDGCVCDTGPAGVWPLPPGAFEAWQAVQRNADDDYRARWLVKA